MNSKRLNWSRSLKSLMWCAMIVGCCAGLPRDAFASASCFCKAIINVGQTAGTTIPNPLLNLGVVATYGTAIGHNKNCEDACSLAAANNANFNDKTWWCQQINAAGPHVVSAYSAVGANGIYRVAQTITFSCTGHVTTCKCPSGWACNGCSPQVDGGVTSDGKCKRLACQPDLISPYPANGAQIGNPSWGFSWDNAFYAWGTAANGGAPTCVTTPWVGH